MRRADFEECGLMGGQLVWRAVCKDGDFWGEQLVGRWFGMASYWLFKVYMDCLKCS